MGSITGIFIKNRFKILILLGFILTAFSAQNSFAQLLPDPSEQTSAFGGIGASIPGLPDQSGPKADVENCNPYNKGKRHANDCPPASVQRDDIYVACMAGKPLTDCLSVMPLPVEAVTRIPEDVCYRNAGYAKQRNHNGIDYAAVKGTPVKAAAAGVVIETSECAPVSGRMIKIKHAKNSVGVSAAAIEALPEESAYITAYVHLATITTKKGMAVKKGDTIGTVGGSNCVKSCTSADQCTNTIDENGYGAHLHFEIQGADGTVYDPMCQDIQGLCGGNKSEENCRKDCSTEPDPILCNANKAKWAQQPTQTSSSASASSTGSQTKCVYSGYRSSFDNICIFCNLFKILFNTASTMAAKSFAIFASSIQTVIIVGFAVWIGIKVMGYVSSMEMKEPRKMIKELLNQAFVVLIVYLLLAMGSQKFMALFMTPLMTAGFELALTFSGSSNCDGYDVIQNGGISPVVGKSILCTIQSIQDSIISVMSLGSTAMCIGFKIANHYIFPHMGYVITGLLLWLAAVILLLVYPFLLVDTMLQLAVAVGLLPAVIGCYAFKITRSYVPKLFDVIMNSILTFVFLTLIIYLIIQQINLAVGDKILAVTNGADQDHTTIMKEIAWTGTAFLKMLFIMLLGWAVLGEGKTFAGQFAGGLKLGGIGESVGGTAASGLHKGSTLGIKAAGNAAKTGVNHAKAGIAKAKVNMIANRVKNSKNKSVDANGNMTATYKPWIGRQKTYTLHSNGAGGNAVEISRQGRGGSTVTKNIDKVFESKVTKFKDGTMKSEINMRMIAGQKLMNRDGSINTVALNAIKQGSTQSEQMINEAVMHQLIKQQMPAMSEKMSGKYTERKISGYTDDQGRKVFEIAQKNADGSITVFKNIGMDGKGTLLEVTDIAKNGYTKKYSTDGVMNKVSTYTTKDGKSLGNEKNAYGLTDYYKAKYGDEIDRIPWNQVGRMPTEDFNQMGAQFRGDGLDSSVSFNK